MIDELRYIEREAREQGEGDAKQAVIDVLLDACHQAHETLYHYDIVQQPNGVDWGPVEMLRAKLIDELWSAITLAQPELKQKEVTQ